MYEVIHKIISLVHPLQALSKDYSDSNGDISANRSKSVPEIGFTINVFRHCF
jgi:hypothetical protein